MAENSKDAFEVVGLNEQLKELDRLLASDPEMEKEIRDLVREVLKEARSELSESARAGLQMKGDLRQAYKAVRTTVYRQLLGGNVNILRKKRAGKLREMPEALPRVGRGGNRRQRSGRTKNLQGYWGSDRGFVLRFLNQGTGMRSIPFTKNDRRTIDKWNKNPNTGNRGSIGARPWFGDASLKALKHAAEQLTGMIEQMIAERFGG